MEIEGLAAGGRGVARPEGMTWFVPGGLPGERVLARARRRHARFVEGSLVRLVRPSPARRPPACPLQPRCGGCPWMILEEGEQRAWKSRLLRDALQRIGRLEGVEPEAILPAPQPFAYRNRVEFTVKATGSGVLVGLHAGGSESRIVDVDRCPVQHETANRILAGVRTFLRRPGAPPPDAYDRREPHRLIIRRSGLTGEALVVLRETSKPFPEAKALAEFLFERHREIAGVVRLRAAAGRRGGGRVLPVLGRDWIEERVGQTTFRLPAVSFIQVSTEMATALSELVIDCAGAVDGGEVFDLYGGVGVYGLALARRGASVTICEADGDAVRCARRAARDHGLAPVRVVRASVADFLREAAGEDRRPRVVIANPPRTGMGAEVSGAIAELGPERLVLVSCDPATLARDTRTLVDRGYAVRRAIPVDLFPQTAHVEALLLLTR